MKEVMGEVRKIHPETLKECPEETIFTLLRVADDLRSGKIGGKNFNMAWFHMHCGTTHCIAGWVATYMKKDARFVPWTYKTTPDGTYFFTSKQCRLFGGSNPSDPKLAADAIENYIYNSSFDPWSNSVIKE